MKRSKYIYICAMFLLCLDVSCDQTDSAITEYVDTPVISASNVTVSADGGTCSFSYNVTNAVANAVVSCVDDVSWISDIDTSIYGTISFIADRNTGDDIRTANLYISYSYLTGSDNSFVVGSVGVIQSGQGAPVLSVQPNAIAASYLGGTYSLTCTIENPADDGELSCFTDSDWIINLNCDAEGNVNFIVVENSDGEELRTATITLIYNYSDTSISKEVTVVQDHPEVVDLGGLEQVIGTYTAHALLYGSGYTNDEDDWTIKIYYNDSDEYDIYIDGLLPWIEGGYEHYGSHVYSAQGYYRDEQIVIPSQVLSSQLASGLINKYYVGFTPCTGIEGANIYYSGDFPDLIMTLDSSTGVWTGNYGELLCGCTVLGDITSLTTAFQASAPGFHMTRISKDTD